MSDLSGGGNQLSLTVCGERERPVRGRAVGDHGLQSGARILDALRAVDEMRRVEYARSAAFRFDIRHANYVGRMSGRFD